MKAQSYFSFCFNKVKQENQFYAIDVTTVFFLITILQAEGYALISFLRKRVKSTQTTNNIQCVASSKKINIASRDKKNPPHQSKKQVVSLGY